MDYSEPRFRLSRTTVTNQGRTTSQPGDNSMTDTLSHRGPPADSPGEAKRPLRADARRNRERILESARAVFSESGVEAQIDDVASRAGVGVGTVYRHFPTKEALMAELVRQKFRFLA